MFMRIDNDKIIMSTLGQNVGYQDIKLTTFYCDC